MQKLLTILTVFLLTTVIQAKDIKYNTLLIPDSLKKNAYAIIRNQEITVELLSKTRSRTTIKKAITVLNDHGKKKAWEYFSYGENKKIVEAKAQKYNSLGIQVEKYTKKDWKDYSYDSYGTSYTKTRVIQLSPIDNKYPYTIEYNIIYERNNTYSIDNWLPVWEYNLSIEQSLFTLIFPPDFKIKYKEYNFGNARITKLKGDGKIDWQIENWLAIKNQPFSPHKKEFMPYVNIDANEFEYDGYEGKCNTWQEFGEFFSKINKGRDELSEKSKNEIDQIIAKCSSNKEKVEKLYKYMQSHTRYINISIGIGGIQTHPATSVAENGYGECKALSNYMLSILQYAGIKSHWTLVYAGGFQYQFDQEYVGHQFNHAMLCVPMQQDTIWLECTSQTIPCGFLGDFTDNRPVLLITENGGELAHTPKYDKYKSQLNRVVSVKVTETGNCTATLNSTFTGLEYNNKRRLINEDKEEQLKLLYKDIEIPNFKIDNFNLSHEESQLPKLIEEINLTLPNYASKSGSRLFLPVNIASKWDYIPKSVIKRTLDIHFKAEYINTDSVIYNIPENLMIEVIPEPFSLETKYGVYKTETEKIDNKIIYKRFLEINSGVYPSDEYDDFIKFFKSIKKNDNAMAILKRKS
ncbi:DUF3857 domain-containing protein [bacterium]|nr:DUF3857 domain-containing protein [bacterium]